MDDVFIPARLRKKEKVIFILLKTKLKGDFAPSETTLKVCINELYKGTTMSGAFLFLDL